MNILFDLVEIFICVLEAYLMFDFFMAFFPLRRHFQRRYMKVAAVVITAVCVRLVNSLDSSMVNIIAMQIIYLSLLFGMFCGNVLRKVFFYMVATAIMIGSEFLWIVVMSLPADFSIGQIQNNQTIILFTALGLKVLKFVFFNLAKQIINPANCKTELKLLVLYSIIPISTMGIMVALAYLNIMFESVKAIQMLLIISSVLVVIGNILTFYVFENHSASMERLRKQEVIITKMEMEEKHYGQIEAVNQEHAAFIHDIRHYMRTIGELAAESREQEILNLLSELQIKISDTENKIYCPNRLLNTILNEKKKAADEKCIKMKITIEPEFMVDHLENMDLIIIMGNLLDNAMEAADKCEAGCINVYLYTQNSASFSVIKIVNNYTGEIKTRDDRIITSKDDKSKHGFGIQNVSTAAERYNGYLQNFYEDGKFTAIVVLPNLSM